MEKLHENWWYINVCKLTLNFFSFSLECDGSLVIITTASKFHLIKLKSLRVRRFNGTFKTAQIRLVHHHLDLAMLEVDDDQVSNEYGELVVDGSLSACQQLVYLGNPGNYVGSSFVGRVCFPCEDLSFDIVKYVPCNDYKSSKLVAPMGHLVFGDLFQRDLSTQSFTPYERNLNGYVPIIQCDGFPVKEGYPGSPIFNLNGKIVGMLCLNFSGYSIAIHVAAIRAFLYFTASQNKVCII